MVETRHGFKHARTPLEFNTSAQRYTEKRFIARGRLSLSDPRMLLLLTVESVSCARTLRQPGKQRPTKACHHYLPCICSCVSACVQKNQIHAANVNENRATVYLSLDCAGFLWNCAREDNERNVECRTVVATWCIYIHLLQPKATELNSMHSCVSFLQSSSKRKETTNWFLWKLALKPWLKEMVPE